MATHSNSIDLYKILTLNFHTEQIAHTHTLTSTDDTQNLVRQSWNANASVRVCL